MNNYQPTIEETRQQILAHSARAARRARIAVRSRAWLWFLATTLFAIVILLVGDAVLQREEVGLRWLWLGLAIASIGVAFWKLLMPALLFRCRPIDLTRWLDRHSPDSAKQWTMAIELAETPSDDPRYGSLAFRKAALAERVAGTDFASLKQVVCWTQVRQALIGFCCVSALSALFFGVWPDYGWLASRRLLMPWTANYWPKQEQLAFVDLPTTVGHGTTLQVEIIDRLPPLPDDIRVELRDVDNESSLRVFPVLMDSEVAIASLPTLHTNVQIRATGGDDRSMEWHSIRVVANPQWKNQCFEITLPDYLRSSQEAMKLLANKDSQSTGIYLMTGQQVEVPAGSQVRFLGELDQPVVSVRVVHEPVVTSASSTVTSTNAIVAAQRPSITAAKPSNSIINPIWTATLDDTGTQVKLTDVDGGPFTITESARWTFNFEIDDDSFLQSPKRWTVLAIPDNPPEVALEVPQLSSIAVDAAVPINALVRDDWGLRDVVAKLSIESMPEQVLELPIPISGPDCEFPIRTFWNFFQQLDEKGIRLQPQDQFLIWIEAHDHLGQVGRSQIEHWSVENPNRQLEILAQRQTSIADQLQEIVEIQATSQQLSQELFEQISEQLIQPSHVDSIAGIEQLQHTIHDQVNTSTDSIRSQLEQTLELLQQNGLSSSELGLHLKEMLDIVVTESSIHTSAARERTSELRTQLQSMLEKGNKSRAWQNTWLELSQSQTDAMDSLDSIMERLDSNRTFDRIRQELQSIAAQQQQISAETQQIQLDQLHEGQEASATQLNELANQQLKMAQDLERWLQQMQQLSDSSPESESSLRSQLNQANQLLIQSQATTAMREAGSRIQSRQLGGAIDAQQKLDQSLREAIGQLADIEQSTHSDQPSSPEQLQTAQLSFLRNSISDFISQQESIVSEFTNLAVLQRSPTVSADLQSLTLKEIKRQESLRDELQSLRRQVDQLPVFEWTLEQISTDMSRTAAMAKRRRLDPDAITSARDALYKLSAMENSLKQLDKSDQSPAPNSQIPRENESPSSEETSAVKIPLASLKLLRSLQLELAEQTQLVDQLADTVRQNMRRSELAAQQEELSGQLRDFLDDMQAQISADAPVIPNTEQDNEP